jgi:hypothetical protein
MYLARKSIAVILASFLLGGIFLCIGMTSTAHAGTESSDMHCSGNATDNNCTSAFDHASYWSHILSVIPSNFIATVVALLIACVCLWRVRRTDWDLLSKKVLYLSSSTPSRSLLPRHSLQDAFSNGILHSKLYLPSS